MYRHLATYLRCDFLSILPSPELSLKSKCSDWLLSINSTGTSFSKLQAQKQACSQQTVTTFQSILRF